MKRVMTTVSTGLVLMLVLSPCEFVEARCICLSESRIAPRFTGPASFCPKEQPHNHQDPRFGGYVNTKFPGITAAAPAVSGIEGLALQPVFNGAIVGGWNYTNIDHSSAPEPVASGRFLLPLFEQQHELRRVLETRVVVNPRINPVRILRRGGSGKPV